MASRSQPVAPISAALEELARGRMVVVGDDDGASGGALVMAAQFVSPAAITFMARTGGGRVALALTTERCDALGLAPMARPRARSGTPFTLTIDARDGIVTGASAREQAHTMRVAIDPERDRRDIVVGGHVQPVRTRDGGVLEQADHANAAVDLARLAGLLPAGVICPLDGESGSPATRAELDAFCATHGLELVTIANVVACRWRRLQVVSREVETRLPTRFGEFAAIGYRSVVDGGHHVALVNGEVAGRTNVLVRVHSECFTGDVLHSLHCECRRRLEDALRLIADEGGALVYVTHDDRASALVERLDSDDGAAMQSRAWRESGIAAQILADLGVSSVRLLSDRPDRHTRLEGYGLRVTGQIPMGDGAAVRTRSRARI